MTGGSAPGLAVELALGITASAEPVAAGASIVESVWARPHEGRGGETITDAGSPGRSGRLRGARPPPPAVPGGDGGD